MTSLQLLAGVACGIGGKRTREGVLMSPNEDAVSIGGCLIATDQPQPVELLLNTADPIVALVADGMGGHQTPERASREVAMRIGESPELLMTPDGLAARLASTHRALGRIMVDNPQTHGMGTTVAGLVFHQSSAVVFNIGDSRVLRFRSGRILQLSVDDARAPLSNPTNAVTQALGIDPEAPADFDYHGRHLDDVFEGDIYVLCSDGLSNCVTVAEIEEVLAAEARPGNKARALYDAALRQNSHDNVSVAVVEVLVTEVAKAPVTATMETTSPESELRLAKLRRWLPRRNKRPNL